MSSLILKLALSVSTATCQFPNICETIRISDDLVIESQYMPEGSVLTDEYMLLRIEDFSVVQAEVENSASACDSRLASLKELHAVELKDSQDKCAQRAAVYIEDLTKANAKIESLSKSLEDAEYYRSLHTWINAALVVGSASLATYIIINK